MQKKINEDFIEVYSEQFAAKISDVFFANKSFINGQEILSISPSKQVNFFVIKLLFNNWQQESERLESPFFDYSAPDVKDALVQFMNVLSRSIKVGRKEFEILMQDAVRDTIFLVMAPSVYMEIEMDRRGTEELSEKTAKNILKYLKVSKDQFSTYFLANIGIDKDEIVIDDQIISAEQLLEEIAYLNEIVPINLQRLEAGDEEDLLEEDSPDQEKGILNVESDDLFKATITRVSETKQRESESDYAEKDLNEEEILTPESDEIESALGDEVSTPAKVTVPTEPTLKEAIANKEVAQTEEVDEIEAFSDPEIIDEAIPKKESVEERPKQELTEEKEKAIDEDEDELSVDNETVTERTEETEIKVSSQWDFQSREDKEEKVKEELDTEDVAENPINVITNIEEDEDEDDLDEEEILNSKFGNSSDSTSIAEAHENQVDSMMSAISLNQRFMFINELFDGEPEAFKESIDMVDACESFDESVEKLVQNYARDYHWDMNAEEVKELLKIIFRRFR